MNMKELRNIHRKKFTTVTEEPGAKEDEFVKTRHHNKDYIPFKVWLRTYQAPTIDGHTVGVTTDFTGKALQIRHGA